VYKAADLRVGRFFGRRGGRALLRVRRPELESGPAFRENALDATLEAQVDEILAKISREGPESLTGPERELLEQASRRLRDRRP
jgi:hypothetical protein